MAADYVTGTASDSTALLEALCTWLVAQGWTQDSLATDGAGKRAHLHKSSVYVNMRSAINEAPWPNLSGTAFYGIALYLGTGYSGAAGWAAQAGGPVKSGGSDLVGASMKLTNGAVTAYHFFDDGADNITVVVERAGGLYTHMGFGVTLDKTGAGTWTGGAYFYAALPGKHGGTVSTVMGDASNHAGVPGARIGPYNTNNTTDLGHAAFVRVDVDSFTSKWLGVSGENLTANDGYTGKIGDCCIEYNTASENLDTALPGLQRLVLGHLVSAHNAQAVLLPVHVHVQRDAGGYSFIGRIPNVFASSAVVSGGFAAASTYTVNGKKFVLFPNFAVRNFD